MKNPYQQNTSPSKNELALTYLPKVKKIACHLSARLPENITVDDLIQVGFIGLMEAIDRYDEAHKTQFGTFAEFRIRGAMFDELRARDWIPRSVRSSGRLLENTYKKLRDKGIDHPSDKELALALDIPIKELPRFIEKTKVLPVLSLQDFSSNEDEGHDPLENIAPSESIEQEEQILQKEVKEQLMEAIKKLPEREQLVLSLYYQEEMNLKEIAAVLGLTESRVSQLRSKAQAQLRSYLT